MVEMRNPTILRVIFVLIVACFVGLSAEAKYAGGSGTADDPYQIATAADLILLGDTPGDYGKHFILTADIDLDPKLPGRKVFGKAVIAGASFAGVFDGNGRCIRNMRIAGQGLFGELDDLGRVENLGIVDANVVGQGGLVGVNWGTVDNCYSTGTVMGSFNFGGLVGENWGTVSNCSSACQVTGSADYGGGLVGRNRYDGQVTNCRCTGSVTGKRFVGGLVGQNWGNVDDCSKTGQVKGSTGATGGLVGDNWASVIDCYSTGQVSGWSSLGGLVGQQQEMGIVVNCHSTSTVIGTNDAISVGGLVGANGGMVSNCYSAGMVAGNSDVGGLLGWNGGMVRNCCSTGTATGAGAVGGLVGSNTGTLRDCCSTGGVTGNRNVGGLVGDNYYDGTVIHCFSIGHVACTGPYGDWRDGVGGLVGLDQGRSVSHSFWDMQASGCTSIGAGTGFHGTGLSTIQMKDIRTYLSAGWDFVGESTNGIHEIWQIPTEGGYPFVSVFCGYRPPQLKGLGTSDAPYLISTAAELGAVIWYDPHACYRLTTSIDLSGINWSLPVMPWFSGVFDGNNLTIRNLTVFGEDHVGLFGEVAYDAEVKNLGVLDVNVMGIGDYVGGLIGDHNGSVNNCYSTGAVCGYSRVGGLVGCSHSSVSNSHNCHSDCEVFGVTYVGGLVGEVQQSDAVVNECYTTGAVSGDDYVGGLAGYSIGTITRCHSTGPASGKDDVGGLVGENENGVYYCSSTGQVNGEKNVGGLVGANSGGVHSSYSTGAVTGTGGSIGGLVGSNGHITECYSAGAVTGPGNDVGGLVGYGQSADVSYSFWDTQTSGLTKSAGGRGKNTVAMKIIDTFTSAGWDFVGESENGTKDIWCMPAGCYPHLSWEGPCQ